jgi:phosphoesterase RecJ-like protein
MRAEGADKRDLDGIVAEMRYTEGTQAAVFFYQTGPDEFKASLRSSSGLDVSKVAAVFGGGGHVKAAGCTLVGPIDETTEKMMNVLSGHLKKAGNCKNSV